MSEVREASVLDGERCENASSAESKPILRATARLPFASFNNRFDGGTCVVVGRGPTSFRYEDLANLTDPIFFINDAVCLEKYARSRTFFFAHDRQLQVWLDGSIRSTAVLPIDGGILAGSPDVVLSHDGPLVGYRHERTSRADLLRMRRDEIAERQELIVHCGTVHSLLHFVWFCGFRRVMFIGCDGIDPRRGSEDGYDRRLENRSRSSPSSWYGTIRRSQDLLTDLFGIESIYLGTPGPSRLRSRPVRVAGQISRPVIRERSPDCRQTA